MNPKELLAARKFYATSESDNVQVTKNLIVSLFDEIDTLQRDRPAHSYDEKIKMAEKFALQHCKEKNLDMAKAVYAGYRAGFLKAFGISGGVRG